MMRWTFGLILLLNAFYWLWHQQQVPLRAHEVPALEVQERAQGLRLLNETAEVMPREKRSEVEEGVCLYLGGFDSAAVGEALQQRLNGLDVQAESIVRSRAAATDYWVYIPPLISRDAALRELRELQARQVEAYIVGDGPQANGLSLGTFSQQSQAQELAHRVSELGYAAQVQVQPRAQRHYWLRLAAPAQALLGPDLIERLAADFPGMRQELLSCEGVATAGEFE